MKPTKCPAKENKTRQEKRKKREGEKVKNRGQDCCANFKPKNSKFQNFDFCACPNVAR